jgi:hypothetical protein
VKKKTARVKRVGKLCEHQEIFEPAELSDSLRALSIPAQQQQLKQLQQVTSSAVERLPLQATRNDSTSIVQQPQSKRAKKDLDASSDDEDATVPKDGKKKRANKDSNAPKQALTTFNLFSQAERENVRITQ